MTTTRSGLGLRLRELLAPHLVIVATSTIALPAFAGPPPQPPVQVIVDMDARTPGFQSSITVSPCTTTVQDIAIWVIDPLPPPNSRTMYSIGFIGGIDRGIAFGHVPTNGHVGAITAMSGTPITPVHAANNAYLWPEGGIQPAFAGPEVQYIEGGAGAPAMIPSQPSNPIFTVQVTLSKPQAGDRYQFHLLDMVTLWSGNGAFSTQASFNSLDSGGDFVPDGTVSLGGIDADPPVPVPPASFYVDYIDGPPNPPPGGAGAAINIANVAGDVTGDCSVNVDDLLTVITNWGPCPTPPAPCPADIAPAGAPDGQVNVNDLLLVITSWG